MSRSESELLKKTISASQALLFVAGIILVMSGLVHVAVWFGLGGDWEGPISWRKPILFGFSTGMTVLSIAWLYSKLNARKGDLILCGVFGFSMVAEVALITVQQWRGVASHFNHNGQLNTVIENWMTYLIIVATLILADFSVRSFTGLDAPKDLKLAIRSGMVFLMVSCLIGFAILYHGNIQVAAGEDPSTFGKAGVTKFPHGVAIHSLQFFPLACWLMSKARFSIHRRTQLTVCLIVLTAMFLLFSITQTLNGRKRFDLTELGNTSAGATITKAEATVFLGLKIKCG